MKNHTNTDHDIIIAGAGPAGLTAGIYAGRAGLNVLILEKEAPGGKVIKTGEIENYPGFTNINGPDLAMNFYEQAMAMGAQLEYSGLKQFDKVDDIFKVSLENGKEITSKALIIATGTKENLLGVPGEGDLYGKGVSYCAVCDGSFYKEMPVAVVGGGYSAVEEAIFLTRFASKVYLIHRREEFRVDNKTLDKAKSNPKIEFILNTTVEKINGSNKVESVDIINLNGEKTNLTVDAIFPFIGQYPITEFINHKDILNDERHIKADENMKTSVEGLFVAGDVRVTPFRQIATAVSDGALAGQNAVYYIENLD
ncbi:thioredoxin reductase [Spiroplasma chinense]|uniref:Thioredoxin reductase n=1 Tax=Spiroplasma chinense TaxID=216932 RepID=A0A5B9Y5J6_9MOLU|nr:thioredoxin-disulfide reductase [Spiroplasma chinense]QEH61302.1 thioredoxin reductase [Spiroplasma chinense]